MSQELLSLAWEKNYQHKSCDETWFNYVLPTADGGQVAVGSAINNQLPGVKQSLFCVKTRADGTQEWIFPYEQPGVFGYQSAYEGNSVAEMEKGGYIIVGTECNASLSIRSRMIIFLIDANGQYIKHDHVYGVINDNTIINGESNTKGHSIAPLSGGGFIVGGITNMEGEMGDVTKGFNPPGDLSKQVLLVTLFSDGKINDKRCYGIKGDEVAYCVRESQDGDFVMAGYTNCHSIENDLSNKYYVVKADWIGIKWEQAYGDYHTNKDYCAHSILQAHDGSFIAGCSGMGHGWLYKLDPATGKIIIAKPVTNVTAHDGKPVYAIETRDGSFLLTGARGPGAYLMMTDATFNKVWDCGFGNDLEHQPRCVAQVTDGSYVTAGRVLEIGQPDRAFLIKIGYENAKVKVSSVDVPVSVEAGSTFKATVEMINKGTGNWTNGKRRKEAYGLFSLEGDGDLFNKKIVPLPEGITVTPGDSYQFEFVLKAPEMPGVYRPAYSMGIVKKPIKPQKIDWTAFGDIATLKIKVL